MKKILSLSILALFITTMFYQCTNEEDLFSANPEVETYATFDELFEEIGSDTIQFVIEDPTIEKVFIGSKGTKLTFPANSCTSDTGTPVAPYTVDFVEIYDRSEMVANNIETVANPNLLVSGGMIYVQVKDANGLVLNMSGVDAVLPSQTDAASYESSMQQFIGVTQTTPSGPVLSWGVREQSETQFDSAAGTYTLYNILGGWTNCDAFGNWPTEDKTQFKVKVTNVTDYSDTKVFFSVNELTTIVSIHTLDGEYVTSYDNSIPTGINGKLIAISLADNGALKFASKDVTIQGDDIFEMEVTAGTSDQLITLLNTLD